MPCPLPLLTGPELLLELLNKLANILIEPGQPQLPAFARTCRATAARHLCRAALGNGRLIHQHHLFPEHKIERAPVVVLVEVRPLRPRVNNVLGDSLGLDAVHLVHAYRLVDEFLEDIGRKFNVGID